MAAESFDVVVAGSGVAGLSAALAAAELGLTVVVLEKDEQLGGTTAFSHGGLFIPNNHMGRAAGKEDSREAAMEYMRFVSGGQAREEKWTAFIDESPVALEFFEKCGVGFHMSGYAVDHYYPKVPGSTTGTRSINPNLISENEIGELAGTVRVKTDELTNVTMEEVSSWGGFQNMKNWDMELIEERKKQNIRGRGAALVIHLTKQCQARGVRIELGVGVADLSMGGGRIVGVTTTDGREIAARGGVVLATGGYESNPDMVARFEDLPPVKSMFAPSNRGDAIALGSRVGASITTIQNSLSVLLGFDIPGEDGEEGSFRLAGIVEMLAPHTCVVNYNGRRFADESYFHLVVTRLREFDVPTHRWANWPCFLIFDQQYVDKFSFAGFEPGSELPQWVARSETVAGLAAELGIDAANLEDTVARFARFAETGIDEDFGRPNYDWSPTSREVLGKGQVNPSLGSIARPPFYGVQMHPAPFASAGITTNGRAQVTDYENKPIPGLYAAGNAAAHTEYGTGYQHGSSIGSGMTFGFVAARTIRDELQQSGETA